MFNQKSVSLTLIFIATRILLVNAACPLTSINIDYTKTTNLTTPLYQYNDWTVYAINDGVCGDINIFLSTLDQQDISTQIWFQSQQRLPYSTKYGVQGNDETIPLNTPIQLMFKVKYKLTAGSTYRYISDVPIWVEFTACITSDITSSSTPTLPMTIGVGETQSVVYSFDQGACYYSMSNFAVTDSNGADISAWVSTFDNGDGTFTMTVSPTLNSQIGTYNIQPSIQLPYSPTTPTMAAYDGGLTVVNCYISSLAYTSDDQTTLTSATIELYQTYSLTFTEYTQNKRGGGYCNEPISYSFSNSIVSYANGVLTFNPTSPSQVGSQTSLVSYNVPGFSPQPGLSPTSSQSLVFTVVDCQIDKLIYTQTSDQHIISGQTSTFSITDYVQAHANGGNNCGYTIQYAATLNGDNKSWVTSSGNIFTVTPPNGDTTTYTFSITPTVSNYAPQPSQNPSTNQVITLTVLCDQISTLEYLGATPIADQTITLTQSYQGYQFSAFAHPNSESCGDTVSYTLQVYQNNNLIATPAFLSLDTTTLLLSASNYADTDVGTYTLRLVPAITPYAAYLTTYDTVSVVLHVVQCQPTWSSRNTVTLLSHVNGAGDTTHTVLPALQGACNYVLTQTVALDTGLVATLDTASNVLTVYDSTVAQHTLTVTTTTTELAVAKTYVETFYIDVTCPVSQIQYTQTASVAVTRGAAQTFTFSDYVQVGSFGGSCDNPMTYSFSSDSGVSWITLTGTTFTVNAPHSSSTNQVQLTIVPTVIGFSPQPTQSPVSNQVITLIVLCDEISTLSYQGTMPIADQTLTLTQSYAGLQFAAFAHSSSNCGDTVSYTLQVYQNNNLIATPAFLSLDTTTLLLSASNYADTDVGTYTLRLVPAITPYAAYLTTYDTVSVVLHVVQCQPTWSSRNTVTLLSHVNGAGDTTHIVLSALQGACNYVLTQTVALDTGLVATLDTASNVLTVYDSTVAQHTLTVTTTTTELAVAKTYVETFYIDVICTIQQLTYTQTQNKYIERSASMSFTFADYLQQDGIGGFCNYDMQYSFSLNDTASWITLSGTSFTINPPLSGSTITYLITITPTVQNYTPQPAAASVQQILVTVMCDSITSLNYQGNLPIDTQIIQLTLPFTPLQLSAFTHTQNCGDKIIQKIQVYKNNKLVTPSFLSFDGALQLKASNYLEADVGNYTVKLIPSITPYSAFLQSYDSVTFLLKVIRCVPTFVSTYSNSILYYTNGNGPMTFNIIQPVQVGCNYQLSQTVSTTKGSSLNYRVIDGYFIISDSPRGNYTIVIQTYTTQLKNSFLYNETISVIVQGQQVYPVPAVVQAYFTPGAEFATNLASQIAYVDNQLIYQMPPIVCKLSQDCIYKLTTQNLQPYMYVTSNYSQLLITPTGQLFKSMAYNTTKKVSLQFILTTYSSGGQQVKQITYTMSVTIIKGAAPTNVASYRQLVALNITNASLNQFGLLRLVFNQELFSTPNLTLSVNRTSEDSSLPQYLTFNVSRSDVNRSQVDLQIDFDYPDYLSFGRLLDNLVINCSDINYINDGKTNATVAIPRQIEPSWQSKLETISILLATAFCFVFVLNLIIMILLSLSMKVFWQVVNICQVVVFLPMIVTLPAAAEYMINYIYALLYLTFIPVTDIKQQVLNQARRLEQTPRQQFVSIMFNDTFTAIMFIVAFLTAFVIIVNLLAYLITKICTKYNYNTNIHSIVQRATLKVKDKIVWNGVIRYTITAYLKTAAMCVISVRGLRDEQSLWVTGGTVLLFIVLVVYPIYVLMKLQLNQKQLDSQVCKQKYSSAYLEVNLDKWSLTYTTVFCFRRLAIALLLILEFTAPGLQLPLFLVQQLIYLTIMIILLPHATQFQNRLEISGEVCILIMAMLLTGVQAGTTPTEVKNAGILFCVVVAFTITYTFLLLLYASLSELYRKIKQQLSFRKQRKQRALSKSPEKLQQEIEESYRAMLQMIPIEFFSLDIAAVKEEPAAIEPSTQSIQEIDSASKEAICEEVSFCKVEHSAEEVVDLENPQFQTQNSSQVCQQAYENCLQDIYTYRDHTDIELKYKSMEAMEGISYINDIAIKFKEQYDDEAVMISADLSLMQQQLAKFQTVDKLIQQF